MPAEARRTEVSLAIAGSGGTGVMTIGELLLATAASSGLYGLMTRSYGPQIRGGESACFLRLGRAPFDKQADMIDLLAVLDWHNIERFQEELMLTPGAWALCEETETFPRPELVQQAALHPIGWKVLLAHVEGGKGRLSALVFGTLCHLLGLPRTAALKALADRFRDHGDAAVEANSRVFKAGWEWAAREWGDAPFGIVGTGALPHGACPPASGVAPSPVAIGPLPGPQARGQTPRADAQKGVSPPASPLPWLLTGNQGIVIGSLVAGLDFFAGYPITPSSEIMEELSHYLARREGVVIQAEDELAAVNMAIGASFGGKKAMTATSGPGFSLMAEGLGLALMAETPFVVVDVQRVGPSTGIATKTEQSDLWAALGSSHGDNPRVVLAPSSVRGCIELSIQAFNLAERLKLPVILLSDQFLAGRTETLDPVPLDAIAADQRRLTDEVSASGRRFAAWDEAVSPMPLPGTPGEEYIAESTEHSPRGWPTSSYQVHRSQSMRRLSKLEPLSEQEGWIEFLGDPAACLGIMAWGSTGGVVREVVHVLRARGTPVKGIIPHLLYPTQPKVMQPLLENLDTLYVVELSAMQQFRHYLQAFYRLPPTVISIARAGGMPFRTAEVLEAMKLGSEQQIAHSEDL